MSHPDDPADRPAALRRGNEPPALSPLAEARRHASPEGPAPRATRPELEPPPAAPRPVPEGVTPARATRPDLEYGQGPDPTAEQDVPAAGAPDRFGGAALHTIYLSGERRWYNKRAGAMVSGPHPTQREARRVGRELAIAAKVEHRVHGKRGQIVAANSYGHDRPDRRG